MRTSHLALLVCVFALSACQSDDSMQVQTSCLQGSPGHRICHEYAGFTDEMVPRLNGNCRREFGKVVSRCDLSRNWVGSCVGPESGAQQPRWRQHHLVHPDRASEYPLSQLIRACQNADGEWQAPTAH